MSKPEPACETARQVHDQCLCLHTQRAARALVRRFDEAFRPLGLTSGQFSLLMSLDRPEPPGLGSVAALLAMDRTTLTAALKPLQRRKLVEVRPDNRDRRNRRLSLTPEGRSLLAAALPVWRLVHAEVDELVGPGDLDAVRRGLRALTDRGKPAAAQETSR
jgi:DNA-binding MarR family transcriptional regulator